MPRKQLQDQVVYLRAFERPKQSGKERGTHGFVYCEQHMLVAGRKQLSGQQQTHKPVPPNELLKVSKQESNQPVPRAGANEAQVAHGKSGSRTKGSLQVSARLEDHLLSSLGPRSNSTHSCKPT